MRGKQGKAVSYGRTDVSGIFEKTKANQVLVVGKDSIYKDGDTRYVYVKMMRAAARNAS